MLYLITDYDIYETGGGCVNCDGEINYCGRKYWFMGEVKPFKSISLYDNKPTPDVDASWQERHLIKHLDEENATALINEISKEKKNG